MKQHHIHFQEKRVPLSTATTNDELSAYDSDCKVPILLDNDFEVWDSLAILEYVSEQYLDAQGWPDDVRARAIARSVSAEMHSSFVNIRNNLPMNCRKTFHNIVFSSETMQEIERVKSLWAQCRTSFGQGGEWLFGRYSIVDAMFAPIVLRFHGYGVALDGVAAYYAECVLNQASIVEWVEEAKKEVEVIEEEEI